MRKKVKRYTAYEPNMLFAQRLRGSLSPGAEADGGKNPLPGLEEEAEIRHGSLTLEDMKLCRENGERDDVVLFCHSMYGMK